MNGHANYCVLEQDRFGGGGSVLVWAGIAHGFRINFAIIEGNFNTKHCQDIILARHVIPLFQNNANITFFSMIMPQAIQLGTL